jgi:class 3 adenylate cyclase
MQDDSVGLEEQFALLKKENAKLKMETSLRKSLANELEKQKVISEEAKQVALSAAEELKSLSLNLSRYVSPQIYKKVFDEQTSVQLNSVRKKLTVFFSDIVGFTQMTDELESEDLTDLLNVYLNAMATIAVRHGATIDKYIGDAVMIFFGDPDSSGTTQDAKKCIEMAIEMQEFISRNASDWVERHALNRDLEVRIGIGTGYCTVGNFGSDDRLDYTVLGKTVNLAARLESNARPGSILVSSETYKVTKGLFDFDDGHSYNLKGLQAQVKAYEVIIKENTKCSVAFAGKNIELKIMKDGINQEEVAAAIKFLNDLNN